MAVKFANFPGAAQAEVLGSTELLGLILEYVNCKDFYRLLLVNPQTFAIAKSFCALRRKFCLEWDPTISKYMPHINPAVLLVLGGAGWYLEEIFCHGIGFAHESYVLRVRWKGYKSRILSNTDLQRLLDLSPHVVISQTKNPVELMFDVEHEKQAIGDLRGLDELLRAKKMSDVARSRIVMF